MPDNNNKFEDIKQNVPDNLMKHIVKSSNLDWVAYNEKTKELYIQFKSSGLYVYYNVPKKIFEDLLKAGSKGRYHAVMIKYEFDYKRLN